MRYAEWVQSDTTIFVAVVLFCSAGDSCKDPAYNCDVFSLEEFRETNVELGGNYELLQDNCGL